MPLTLECFCAGSGIKVFELYSLTFRPRLSWIVGGTLGASVYINLIDATDNTIWNEAAMATPLELAGLEEREVPIPLSRKSNYGSFYVQLRAEQTAMHGFDGPASYSASWDILQRYRHIDGETGQVSYVDIAAITVRGGTDECFTEGGLLTIQVVMGAAGGSVLYLRSSPFIPECWTEQVDSGAFTPPLLENVIDTEAAASLCLCATGGVGPYYFSILDGRLPCGQTLNQSTGCIEGEADGSCQGSEAITYQVVDSAGATAQVMCGLSWPCAAAALGNSLY